MIKHQLKITAESFMHFVLAFLEAIRLHTITHNRQHQSSMAAAGNDINN